MSPTGDLELITAPQAEDLQRRIAGGLLSDGLTPGDRVLVATTSGGPMLATILGALRVGIVPVVLNSGLLDTEREVLVADAEPAATLDDAAVSRLSEAQPAELAPWPLARPIHYTSGTTGRAKGVESGPLSESEAALLVAEERELWGFEAGDVHLVNSPFHHSVAIRFAAGTLLAGGSVLVQERFDAGRTTAALSGRAELQPDTTFLVPAHLQRIFASSGPSEELDMKGRLRLVAHAGSPCPPALKLAAIEAFGERAVWEFYGSTEGQFTACSSTEWSERRGTVGRARKGRHLAVDQDGRIWCTVGSHARFHYRNDPGATRRAWRPPHPDAAIDDPHGAFTVGDLGRLDDDGYLFIDGRRDDLIITGGVNVYPAEVEAVLADVPGVVEVAVFGREDERWGQRICAAFTGTASPEEVARHAVGRLAAYKRPKELTRIDELPRTATGKVKRLDLPGLIRPGT